MSQVRLTLRQPPNVEFVHGYPGIPSGGTDRPQAAVKGAVEVRATNPAGVKSKWLRVELRKVETIPGSSGNTFYDYVGPSPVDIWRAKEEWGVVQTCDIPFEIRIPESIPPTLALEENVGIRYELIASICTKGKRGFLRKRKSNVVSAQTEIIIDKHDLHSTWPVYCQPDIRQVALDGVVLAVERHSTCYAPGDRVIVTATVRSEFQTVILRGFEISLRESRTFRAGAYAQGKKTLPQTRVGNLVNNKFAVNVNLMGGMQHQAELALSIPQTHTTTTLNSARHIDITYVLCVRAIMGTGQPVIMELPVIMSNWPRSVSEEATRRIGPAPGLSLLPPNAMHSVIPLSAGQAPTRTYAGRPSQPETARPSTANTISSGATPHINGFARPDEFGQPMSRTHHSARSVDSQTHNPRRLTITNAEIPVDPLPIRHRPSANASVPTNANGYIDEKKLYERARAGVERVQSGSPPPSRDGPSSSSPRKWMSAEEEKLALYQRAQAAVSRTHGQEGSPDSAHPSAGSSSNRANGSGNGYMSAVDEKAALKKYQDAKAAVDKAQSAGFVDGESSGFEPSGSTSVTAFETAAQEKARLKRELASRDSSPTTAYESAAAEKARLKRELAERDHMSSSWDRQPPAFEATSSSNGSPSPSSSAFESAAQEKARLKRELMEKDLANQEHLERARSASSSVAYESAAAEKARLRRELEERDRYAQAPYDRPPPFAPSASYGSPSSSPPPFAGGSSSSSPPYAGGPSYGAPVLTEKEVLARHFAAQDAVAAGRSVSPRPIPTPPRSGSSMSAADEKKMLAARYTGESYAPPPLMPRPPVDYIKETQDEDARVSQYMHTDIITLTNGEVSGPPPLPPKPFGEP